MSGSGPFGPITQGVWQSLQPEVVTRYFPRTALSFAAGAAWASASGRTRAPTAKAVNIDAMSLIMECSPFEVDGPFGSSAGRMRDRGRRRQSQDRKSTRLN